MTDEEYCELNHVTFRISTELPPSVRALTYHDQDGNEFVLINDLCCPAQKKKSAAHELEHIKRGEQYDIEFKEYG